MRETVETLLSSGAVQRWTDLAPELRRAGHAAGARPHVVMPVLCGEKSSSTPEDRKLRFIHDCRFLNNLLEKWHFSLEQLRDFVKCLSKGDLLIKADLKSAYHHVEVALRFRTLLGFTFDGIDYVWAVLPFGLSVAGYTFCRVAAVPATVIRRSGLVDALITSTTSRPRWARFETRRGLERSSRCSRTSASSSTGPRPTWPWQRASRCSASSLTRSA